MKKLNTFFIGLIVMSVITLTAFGFYQKWLIGSYQKNDFKHSKLKPNF